MASFMNDQKLGLSFQPLIWFSFGGLRGSYLRLLTGIPLTVDGVYIYEIQTRFSSSHIPVERH